MPAHPVYYASYVPDGRDASVPHVRDLQSRLLQVTPRSERPCGLLNIRNFVPRLQDFHLSASFSKKELCFSFGAHNIAFVKARQTELGSAEIYKSLCQAQAIQPLLSFCKHLIILESMTIFTNGFAQNSFYPSFSSMGGEYRFLCSGPCSNNQHGAAFAQPPRFGLQPLEGFITTGKPKRQPST